MATHSVTFPPELGGDGNTYTDDSNPATGMGNDGHRQRFMLLCAQVVAMAQTTLAQAQAAGGSAGQASDDAGDAHEAAMAAVAALTALNGLFLGAKAANPATDNLGNALQVGAMFFHTPSGEMRVWDGASWRATYLPAGAYFLLSGGTLTGTLNEAKGADIASAATVNLTAATGNLVHITGTTAITAVTLASGADRVVVFDGALTLTHHATNNNLPGGVNITTAAGDRALYRGDGATVRCLAYFRADGSVSAVAGINELKGSDIASAASMAGIWAAAKGNVMGVTGTTTTTGFGTAPQAGARRTLLPAAAWPITAGASVTIPGVASGSTYTCAAGDRVDVLALTTGTYLVTISKASGTAVVPSGLPYLHVREEQTSGTASADTSIAGSGVGTARTLNSTVSNSIPGASLSSNQVSLPAGTYYGRVKAPARASLSNSAAAVVATLYNQTDLTPLLAGVSQSGSATGSTASFVPMLCVAEGTFTLAGTKSLSLRQYGSGVNGGGAAGMGLTEVYGSIEIWRL